MTDTVQADAVQRAWVPFEAGILDRARCEAAVAWTLSRVGRRPIVVISEDRGIAEAGSWERLRDQDLRITWRTRDRELPSRYAGILAFLPREHELGFSVRWTRGGEVLCVVEFANQPVTAWARDVQALNLRTNEIADPYSLEVARILGKLFASGNSGWSRDIDRDDARRALSDLRGDDFQNTNDIRIVAASRGFAPNAIEMLHDLAREAGFPDPPMPDGSLD